MNTIEIFMKALALALFWAVVGEDFSIRTEGVFPAFFYKLVFWGMATLLVFWNGETL